MAGNYLEQHFDPALKPPTVKNREELEQREMERIRRALAVVLIAGTIPRRLGGKATDDELALDKKRARRTAHALGQSLKGWTKKKGSLPLDDKIRQEGSQLLWERWFEAHIAEVRNELRCLSTWAVINGEQRWGRSAVVKLNNELKWIEFAARD